jgi:hypothetical protein
VKVDGERNTRYPAYLRRTEFAECFTYVFLMIFVIERRYFLKLHSSTSVGGGGDTEGDSFAIYGYACYNVACYCVVVLNAARRHNEKTETKRSVTGCYEENLTPLVGKNE